MVPSLHAPGTSRSSTSGSHRACPSSHLGDTTLASIYDNYSANFEFYPLGLKSDTPKAVDRYFRDAKLVGVDVDKGGILYRDNEIVLNSVAMAETEAEHDRVSGNSNVYEPWQNAGVESTYRYGPAEMRKLHARSGVPDVFWNFSAMTAAKVVCVSSPPLVRRSFFTRPGALMNMRR